MVQKVRFRGVTDENSSLSFGVRVLGVGGIVLR
jgi:hypothetical protein